MSHITIKKSQLYYTKCGYVFHKSCYVERSERSKETKTTCPLCNCKENISKKIENGKKRELSEKVNEYMRTTSL